MKQPKKHNEAFKEVLRKHARLKEDRTIVFDGIYASLHVDVCWNNTVVTFPCSHLVFFLTHNRWPNAGMVLDHVNNNPFDNRLENLAEITEIENHKKKRNRTIYRSYGRGKYWHGVGVYLDKRDGRYYVAHQLSRGQHKKELGKVVISLGGFDTLDGAETRVRQYIAENGLNT